MWQHGHFCWNDLMTRDAEKAFYGKTVGWQFEGMRIRRFSIAGKRAMMSSRRI